SEHLADIVSLDSRRDSRGVPYEFWTVGCWWKSPPESLKREYHSIRQMNTETSTEFMQRFLRLAGFLGAAAGTEEEQAKNFHWGRRRRGGSDNHRSNNNYSGNSNRNSGYGRDQRNRGQQSNRYANSGSQQSRVPLRATPIQFALLVDADTQESVVELLVLASSVVKLAIYRKIARRTPLRVHWSG
nr:zinc finger, CCHC-type, retrotransposon Gag domain protein [Tanacetum cinerariifolium]